MPSPLLLEINRNTSHLPHRPTNHPGATRAATITAVDLRCSSLKSNALPFCTLPRTRTTDGGCRRASTRKCRVGRRRRSGVLSSSICLLRYGDHCSTGIKPARQQPRHGTFGSNKTHLSSLVSNVSVAGILQVCRAFEAPGVPVCRSCSKRCAQEINRFPMKRLNIFPNHALWCPRMKTIFPRLDDFDLDRTNGSTKRTECA